MERLKLTDIPKKVTEGFRRIPKPSMEGIVDAFTGIPSMRKAAESLPTRETNSGSKPVEKVG